MTTKEAPVAAPSPSPEPITPEQLPTPVPEIPAIPAGPVCGACGTRAVVNWRRRPTDDELVHVVHAEQSRRDELLLLADPQQPAPEFGPLPTVEDTVRAVYACAEHAIDGEAAAFIHQGACTAPNETGRWGCDCIPEPLPEPEPDPAADPAVAALPAHWLTGSA
jgi:hypothetical protein